MNYLGKTSLSRCYRLHPVLAACVALAITDCEVDFTVSETVRSPERQKELLAQKKTWTLNSKHLKQSDGFSHAVDLVPLVSGKLAWDKCQLVKEAMFRAAEKVGIKIRWGGDWNQNGSSKDEHQKGSYDGPHFELIGTTKGCFK